VRREQLYLEIFRYGIGTLRVHGADKIGAQLNRERIGAAH
jgi:hypothetical protein